jgi:hypothetical protein
MMQQVTFFRFAHNDDATLSWAKGLNQGYFGLEDQPQHGPKVAHETRIPAGNYRVRLRSWGRLHGIYANRYGDAHKGMLELLDVPGFEHILIHAGNNDDHTSGCILIGRGANAANMTLQQSRPAYVDFYKEVLAAAEAGNLVISIVDGDLGGV